jgi:hypothetical protein
VSPRRYRILATWLTIAVVLIGVTYGTWVAGGMDSYGYVSQADRWRSGQLVVPEPIVDSLPWPNAIDTLVQIGYVAAPDRRSSAPYYAPGLPLLMALASFAGHCAIFWVVPLSGGLLVASTFVIGRRIHSDAVGLVAATLVATSPAMLFLLTAPMSDVPAAAFWALATALLVGGPISNRGAVAAGLAASIAILIRPNLVPLAAILALYLVSRRLVAPVVAFSLAVLPGCLLMASLNHAWFGSAFRMGATQADVFSLQHALPNLARYPKWFVQTQTPLAILGVLALAVPLRRVWRTTEAARTAAFLAPVVVVSLLIHIFFLPLDDWWYLRYLLAAWPAIFVGLAAVLATLWNGTRPWMRPAGVAVAAALCIYGLRTASTRGAFGNGPPERRYVEAARLLQDKTEPDAVILAMQHSGTARYYGGRMTLRYDMLAEDWLDRAAAWLEARGRQPYVLLDAWELDRFRQRFAAKNRLGALNVKTVFISQSGGPLVYLFDLRRPAADVPAPIVPASLEARCDAPASAILPLR